MTKFSEVASLYLKCQCRIDGEKIGRFSGLDYSQFDDSITMITIHFSDDLDDQEHNWVVYNDDENLGRIKPILRPLSTLTEDEALHLSWLILDDPRINLTKEEVSIDELVQNDGGNLVDADVALVIQATCRCFEGQIVLYPNGGIILFDDSGDGVMTPISASVTKWLISKSFDLFGLTQSGQAIDATTLKK